MTDAKESEKLRELEAIARGNGYWSHIEPFVEAITRERDELRTLAKDAINYMVFEVVACHGLKCRERNCESCCDEDDAKAFVLKSREVIAALTAAIAKGNA